MDDKAVDILEIRKENAQLPYLRSCIVYMTKSNSQYPKLSYSSFIYVLYIGMFIPIHTCSEVEDMSVMH